MTGLFALTTRKPLAVLLSVFCLAGAGGTVATLTLDTAPAHAGTNDETI